MPLTKRLGAFGASVSMRLKVTEAADAASALWETKTAPNRDAAQSVPVSPGVRTSAAR